MRDQSHDPEPIAVSVNEATRLSGAGRTWLYARIAAGELRSRRVGGRRFIDLASLREMLTCQIGNA